jgi:hypothetical protein
MFEREDVSAPLGVSIGENALANEQQRGRLGSKLTWNT